MIGLPLIDMGLMLSLQIRGSHQKDERSFFIEYLNTCTFYQFLQFFCTDPELVRSLKEECHFDDFESNYLDLYFSKLRKSDELSLLEKLNEIKPTFQEIYVSTKSFISPLEDILRTLSLFREVKRLTIQLVNIKTKWAIDLRFDQLSELDVRNDNKGNILFRTHVSWVAESILRRTKKLTKFSFSNSVFTKFTFLYLIRNKKLTELDFINVNFIAEYDQLVRLFNTLSKVNKLTLIENQFMDHNINITATRAFLDSFKTYPNIKELKLTIFDNNEIKYGNIEFLTNLRYIEIHYFETITSYTIENFMNVMKALSNLNKPIKIRLNAMSNIKNYKEKYSDPNFIRLCNLFENCLTLALKSFSDILIL